jgi:hypothetical protein
MSGDFFWTLVSGYRDMLSDPLFILAPAFPSGTLGAVVSTLCLVLFPSKWKEIFGMFYACIFVSATMVLCLLIFAPFSKMNLNLSVFLGITNGMFYGAASGFATGYLMKQYGKYSFRHYSYFVLLTMLLAVPSILYNLLLFWDGFIPYLIEKSFTTYLRHDLPEIFAYIFICPMYLVAITQFVLSIKNANIFQKLPQKTRQLSTFLFVLIGGIVFSFTAMALMPLPLFGTLDDYLLDSITFPIIYIGGGVIVFLSSAGILFLLSKVTESKNSLATKLTP